eukprot:COSAG01_NODE_2599_length_7398_cov_3.522263_9_plen_123_part_00
MRTVGGKTEKSPKNVTSVERGTLNPVWEQAFEFYDDAPGNRLPPANNSQVMLKVSVTSPHQATAHALHPARGTTLPHSLPSGWLAGVGPGRRPRRRLPRARFAAPDERGGGGAVGGLAGADG